MMAAVETARPLAGRLIVITRPKAQAASFAALLEAAGARVLVAPTIVIEPPSSWAPLDDALRRAGEYDWAVFTSVNGVAMVKARLSALGLSLGVLGVGLRLLYGRLGLGAVGDVRFHDQRGPAHLGDLVHRPAAICRPAWTKPETGASITRYASHTTVRAIRR